MAQKFVARLPDDLKAQLAALAGSEGISQNALVVKALQRYVMAPDSPVPSADSEVMADVMARLEQLEVIVGMVQRDRPGAARPKSSMLLPEISAGGDSAHCPACGFAGPHRSQGRRRNKNGSTSQRWRCPQCDRNFSTAAC